MLDGCVIEALENAGIAASAIPPGAVLRRTDGAIKRFDASIFRAYLELGIVPVTFGDVVLDTDARHRFGILSGDDIMVELARAFSPKRVIFAMDVDGVLDGPPDAGGKVVPIVSRVGDVPSTASRGGRSAVADVTRGISGKVARALEISKALGAKGRVMLINGGVEGRLRDAMMGKAVIGTRVIAPTKAKGNGSAKGRKGERKRGA
jgi:isopentenyl phosphate kinase